MQGFQQFVPVDHKPNFIDEPLEPPQNIVRYEAVDYNPFAPQYADRFAASLDRNLPIRPKTDRFYYDYGPEYQTQMFDNPMSNPIYRGDKALPLEPIPNSPYTDPTLYNSGEVGRGGLSWGRWGSSRPEINPIQEEGVNKPHITPWVPRFLGGGAPENDKTTWLAQPSGQGDPVVPVTREDLEYYYGRQTALPPLYGR